MSILANLGTRHPVIRTGERDEIPGYPWGEGCRIINGFIRTKRLTGEYPKPWHRRQPIEGDTGPLAYCAHCDAPGVTGYLL